MSLITEILNIFPPKEALLSSLTNVLNCDQILSQIYSKISENKQILEPQKCLNYLDIVLDFLHDSLHVGEWHAVDVKLRKSYSVASYFKIIVLLLSETNSIETLNECTYILDLALMLGDGLGDEVLQKTATLIAKSISELSSVEDLCLESPAKKVKIENETSDIPIEKMPSVEYFLENHYKPEKPVLLKEIINHWPALEKWKDPKYLIEKAGPRTVPVELGSQYTSEDWSQSLIKFEDFLKNFVIDPKDETVAYLAQHDLFDQIPELKEDICQPEYILSEPRIKAWLGPKGTVSPLHTDPTHNLLCQVFGSKKVILASPEDTKNLYPHEHFILNNTSQVDAENLDFNEFPSTKNVKFMHLTLKAGEVLYIPPKWWHHIRSLSPSFSVSFWFE